MGRVDAMLMLLVCVATVAALPAVGLVLVVAMLTIPPATARLWTDRLGVMVVLSACIAAGSAAVGTLISANIAKLSAGPVITLCAAAIFIVSVLCAPTKGVLTQWLRTTLMQRRMAIQNALRAIYEVAEAQQPATGPVPPPVPPPVPLASIQLKRAWNPAQLARVLARAQRAGLVTITTNNVALTPQGAREAQRLVRAHRLWELYLIDQAAIAHDHVDRDADSVEHVLPEGLQRQLEQRLRELGRMPGEPAVVPPPSPHVVPGASGVGVHA
jgi:manganese/zinc/iron transport system permease protein